MATKPNYQFEKRQREQEKKKKQAEKALKKAAAADGAQQPKGPVSAQER